MPIRLKSPKYPQKKVNEKSLSEMPRLLYYLKRL
jgi:hypothetical protein